MPVPRLDVRPRRTARRRPALGARGRDRDRASSACVPLRAETWGPFVFVNPDPDAGPLADFLEDVPERIAAAGIDVDALRFLQRAESELAANWKLCAENFLECYHCAVAHPGFSAVVDVSPDSYLLETNGLRMSQNGPPRPEPRGTYDPTGEVERGQFHLLFPNTVINVMPGRPNLSIGPIVPVEPERTYRQLDYFVAPDAPDAWIEEMLAFDAEVGAEDTRLVERVQEGVRSGLVEEGRLLPESEQPRRPLPGARRRRARLNCRLRRRRSPDRNPCARREPMHDVVMATPVRTEPSERLLNRELSLLDFHARVLELAADESVPLLGARELRADLRVQPRRVLPGARRRPPRPGRVRAPDALRRRADAAAGAGPRPRARPRAHRACSRASGRRSCGPRSPPRGSSSAASRTATRRT